MHFASPPDEKCGLVGKNSGWGALIERLPYFPFVEYFPLTLALFELPARFVSAGLVLHGST
jgi:hypothetical protein